MTARDYFQDITPPDEPEQPYRGAAEAPSPRTIPVSGAPDRSIRNINMPNRPTRPTIANGEPPRPPLARRVPVAPREPSGSRWWLWAIAAIALILVVLALILFVFRSTTVTVTPQSQPVVFDQTAQFTAYPAASAATGTLPYTLQTTQLSASENVQATGTQEVTTKASGTITVVNDYSTSAVQLIANTRFETQSGLIFRVPAAVVIPGKQGTTAGTVQVTVIADQPGAQYNIAPQSHLTVPGLQSTPQEYANVYAYSTASTTGGYSGQEPAVDPSALQGAISDLQSQLQQKVASYAQSLTSSSTVALAALAQITYQNEPNTQNSDGSVSVNETANVVIPSFPSDAFAETIAQMVAADAQNNSITLVPGQNFGAELVSATTTVGTAPITFSLSGQAQLIWNIDTQALAQALAGHTEASFQAIVSNFPGVQSAHARIEPFWQSTFPSDPADIHITILQPAPPSSS